MGITVLLNPFGAERSTRQRLLEAIHQTGDYILSQRSLQQTQHLQPDITGLPMSCSLYLVQKQNLYGHVIIV